MPEYKLKRKRGIDDLLEEFAFRGNSQGDESVSNDVKNADNEWMSFNFGTIDKYDQEAVLKEAIRRVTDNAVYIQKLKDSGRYGEEYELSLTIKPNSLFDAPIKTTGNIPLESYRMIFIDQYVTIESKKL